MFGTSINSSPSARKTRTVTDSKSGKQSSFKEKKVSDNVPDDAVVDKDLQPPHNLSPTRSIHSASVATPASDVSSLGNDTLEGDFRSSNVVDKEFLNEDTFIVTADQSAQHTETSDASTRAQSLIDMADQSAVKRLEQVSNRDLMLHINKLTEPDKQGGEGTRIEAGLSEQLKTLARYNARLDAQMQQLNELGEKLKNHGLSDAESLKMKALMHCNKYNLSTAQSWLSAQATGAEKGTMNEPTATLLTALSNRLAQRHIELADTISLYEDSLPDREPLPYSDRVEYNLLTARASLRAFKSMALSQKDANPRAYKKMLKIYPALMKHCKALERTARLVKGQVKMDASNPKLELAPLHAWTGGGNLAEKGKEVDLPQTEMNKLMLYWDEAHPKLPLSHPLLSQPDMIQLFIEHQFKKANIDAASIPKFETAYKQSLIFEINQGKWPIIDKPVKFKVGDRTYNCHSRITPGVHLAKQFEKPYRNNGISYMDRQQSDHTPNLAHTQLTTEDGEVLFSAVRHGIIDAYDYNEKNLRKFSDRQLAKMAGTIYDDEQKSRNGIDTSNLEQQLEKINKEEAEITKNRSLSSEEQGAYGVRKAKLGNLIAVREKAIDGMVHIMKHFPESRASYIAQVRNIASRNMARELLSTAIVSDPTKLSAALRGETVNVTMNSVALVTPDWYRSRYMKGGPTDERFMLRHQIQALQSLDNSRPPGKPIELMIKDENGAYKEIKVNVKVRAFNFGVNNYALAKAVLPSHFPIWRSLMGWGFSAKVNNPQLRELLGPANKKELGGAVAEKLSALERSDNEKDRKRLILLNDAATQAKRIWRKRSFWSGNNEPYKMVSRLTLISHLMDETTLFNCKSGKDRTGQLDAEVKYLAAVGHTSGRIPEPDILHTDESRKMRTAFTLDAGNMELQRMNTGLPGYKLRNVPGLKTMMEEGTQTVYEGGSDYV